MTTVVLIDDHDIIRYGLESLLTAEGLVVAASVGSLAEGLRTISDLRPDLVITDMGTGDSQGLETVRQVVAAQGGRPVLVVAMQDEALYGEQVLAAGAAGYVMMKMAHAGIVPAVRAALRGGTWTSPQLASRLATRYSRRHSSFAMPPGLTTREIEIMELLKLGKSTKQIATSLRLSVRTVDSHRSHLKQKLELHSGAELIAYASKRF